VIKLGRVRFKVKDLEWMAAAGRGTADCLGDDEGSEVLRDELEEAEVVKTAGEVIW